jgi:hypothetical protein
LKKSQLDRAIEALEGKRAVLDAAIAELKQQQTKAPRRPRVLKKVGGE